MKNSHLSNQDSATLLAALRYWQANVPLKHRKDTMPNQFYDQEPLGDEEIDELCIAINTMTPIPLLTVEEEAHILCAIHRLEDQVPPEDRASVEPVFYQDGTHPLTDEESEALREKINCYVEPMK